MKKLTIALTVVSAAVLLSGCASAARPPKSPCDRLAKPTASEIAAAQGGAEVERKIGRVECIVRGDRWVLDS